MFFLASLAGSQAARPGGAAKMAKNVITGTSNPSHRSSDAQTLTKEYKLCVLTPGIAKYMPILRFLGQIG